MAETEPTSLQPSPQLLELQQGLLESGFVVTDPSFNLCPEGHCVEVIDVVNSGQRRLFYEHTAADDQANQVLGQALIPQFARAHGTDGFVELVIPNSAKPLSRIIAIERPKSVSNSTAVGLSEVILNTRHLLEAIFHRTGAVPADISWEKLAFVKEGHGAVYLVPPLALEANMHVDEALSRLLAQAEQTAAPGNIPKIERAFTDPL